MRCALVVATLLAPSFAWTAPLAEVGRANQIARVEPRREAYATVAVFEDLYGNRWDLLQPK